MERKGIELPGETGRWTEIGIQSCRVTTVLEDLNNHRLFRRLPDPPPMPELRVGDGVVIDEDTKGVVVRSHDIPHRVSVADHRGVCRLVDKSWVEAILRDGTCIWKREP